MWPLKGLARDLIAAHMLQHLVVMNMAALLIAMVWRSMRRETGARAIHGITASLAALSLFAVVVEVEALVLLLVPQCTLCAAGRLAVVRPNYIAPILWRLLTIHRVIEEGGDRRETKPEMSFGRQVRSGSHSAVRGNDGKVSFTSKKRT